MKSPHVRMKSSSRSPELEKAHTAKRFSTHKKTLTQTRWNGTEKDTEFPALYLQLFYNLAIV